MSTDCLTVVWNTDLFWQNRASVDGAVSRQSVSSSVEANVVMLASVFHSVLWQRCLSDMLVTHPACTVRYCYAQRFSIEESGPTWCNRWKYCWLNLNKNWKLTKLTLKYWFILQSRILDCNSCYWFADSEIARHLRDEVERIQRQQQSLNELYQEYGRKGQELKNEKRVCSAQCFFSQVFYYARPM